MRSCVHSTTSATVSLMAGADLPLPDGVYLDGTAWEQLSTGRRWCTAIDLATATYQ